MPSKYFTIDDCATFVRHSGPTTLPGCPPAPGLGGTVVALHDAGRHGGDWDGVFGLLDEARPQAGGDVLPALIHFDQPGHGRSGSLDALGDVARLAQFSTDLLDRLEVEQPVLMGHGLGGAIALRMALDHPKRIRGAITLGTGLQQPVPDTDYAYMGRVTEGKAKRPFNPGLFAPGATPDLMRKVFMSGLKTDPRATYADLTACRQWDDTARLGGLAAPLLVLVGEHQLGEDRTRAEALSAAVPEARFKAIGDAGHMLPLEDPAAVVAAMSDFVGSLS